MSAALSPTIRTILVATDFSDTASAAAEWAMEIARSHGARVELVHALALPAVAPSLALGSEPLDAQLRERAALRLEEAAAPGRHRGIDVEVRSAMGSPRAVILERIEELRPDLVVLGTEGRTGLQQRLLGSTSRRVVQGSAAPVLVVHPSDRDQHRRIQTVLVPTDFSEDAHAVAAAARRLLLPRDSHAEPRLVLFHAYSLPVEYTAYGLIPTSLDYLRDTGAEAEEQLEQAAQALRQEGLTVETVAREGFAPEAIVQEAREREVDLIALGTHGRSGFAHWFLGSTAEQVMATAPCPVMTLRRPG
jgi:nucleotide-binding universal stress UspA family protein